MSFLVKDKAFYKTMLSIAIPIALQNLINFGVNMMDTVMLGALGETALSASSLANQPGFVFMITTFGIANGGVVIAAQYWGKREMEPIRYVIGISLKVMAALALLFSVLILGFPEQVMRIFTDEEPIIAEGIRYLRVIGFSYLFVGISNTLTISLRSIEVVRISIAVSLSSFVTNVVLNYILIFGKLGFPALGVQGAAIATLIARILECVIIITYLVAADKRLKLKWKHVLTTRMDLLKDYGLHASPVIVGEILWSFGMAVQAMILGRLGGDAVAANSICTVVQQFVTVFVFGIANASAVVIGKTLGTGDFSLTHRYAKTLQLLYLGIGVICGLSMFLMKDLVISIYNISEGTKLLTRQFLTVNSFIVFSLSYTAPAAVGILRGGGDSRFVLLMDLIFVWGVTIPLGALAGLYLHLPMPLVYLFLKIDEPIKIIFDSWRLRGTKWMRNVTRNEIPEG